VKDEWYSPGQIRYLRDDIIWMIAVVLPLDAGCWPPAPGNTINNPESQKTPSHAAPFENPCCVEAELLQRIKMTGEAGEALVDEVLAGIEHYQLLSRPAKRALNYISSGPKRRRTKDGRLITYAEWKRDRKKNRKYVKNL